MLGVALTDWLLLFGLALFAFIFGGGFWAYCMRNGTGVVAAVRRFQIYGWLFLPLATLSMCLLIWLRVDEPWQQLGLAEMPDLYGMLAGAVTGAVLAGLAEVISSWMSPALDEETAAHMATEFRELPSLVIVAPIGEELSFRGFGLFAFGSLGLLWAGVISTFAFAVMHVKPAMVLMGFAGGVLLYGVYAVWGNLWVVVLAHAIANLGSWLMMRNKVNRLVSG